MARLDFNKADDLPLDRRAHRAAKSEPTNSNARATTAPAEMSNDFDLDNVFEEPSRRPL